MLIDRVLHKRTLLAILLMIDLRNIARYCATHCGQCLTHLSIGYEVVAVKVMRESESWALYGLTVSLAVGGASQPSPRPSTKPHQPPREHALTQPRQRVTRLRHLYPVNHCAWGNPQSHARIDFSESIRVPRSVLEFMERTCLRSVPSMICISLSEVLSVV